MKRILSVMLIIVLLFGVALSEESTWTCPKCGREGLTGKFCGTCGTPKPEEKTWNGFVPGVNCELEENLLKLTEGCDGVSFDVYLQDIHAILESTEAELGYLTYSVYIFGGEFAESAGDEFVEACENSESIACLESSADEETRESILLEKVVEILETEDLPICFLIVEYNEYPLTVTITKNCRVRGQAGMSGELLGELSAGTAVKSKGTVIAADGTGAWYEIEYQGRQAFVAASVVNETEAVKPTAAPTQKATETPKPTVTQTVKPTVTATVTVKPTAQPTATATLMPTATVTPKPSATATQGPTTTAVPTLTTTPTATVVPTVTPVQCSHSAWTLVAHTEGHRYECAQCGAVQGMMGHSFGEWSIVAEAKCGDTGSKNRKCSVCKYTETDIIPAPGSHNFVAGTNSTSHYDECTLCGKRINLENHIPIADQYIAGGEGCSSTRTHLRTCSVCAVSYREKCAFTSNGVCVCGAHNAHMSGGGYQKYDLSYHKLLCAYCGVGLSKERHTYGSDGKCIFCEQYNSVYDENR